MLFHKLYVIIEHQGYNFTLSLINKIIWSSILQNLEISVLSKWDHQNNAYISGNYLVFMRDVIIKSNGMILAYTIHRLEVD